MVRAVEQGINIRIEYGLYLIKLFIHNHKRQAICYYNKYMIENIFC